MEDWRLSVPKDYLYGITLQRCKWHRTISNDHDHCDFCWAKFSEKSYDLHEGYCTLDKSYWICEDCFFDFKDLFHWKVK